MRLGMTLDALLVSDWRATVEAATEAERLGLELLAVGCGIESHDADPLLVAAALAPVTAHAHVIARVPVGIHPVHLAERAAVADRLLGGRLVLVIEGADPEDLRETVEIVRAATTSRPFRYHGRRWKVPAGLDENDVPPEATVRVTPSPAQLMLPIWVSGAAAAEVANALGVPWLADASTAVEVLRSHWNGHPLAGPAGGPRPRLISVPAPGEAVDSDALVRQLLDERAAWGLDLALIDLPRDGRDGDDVGSFVRRLATEVIPRVQLSTLPTGLERFWEQSSGPAAG